MRPPRHSTRRPDGRVHYQHDSRSRAAVARRRGRRRGREDVQTGQRPGRRSRALSAATLTGMALGIPHAHVKHPPSGPPPVPPIPLPPLGPIMLGTNLTVLINNKPTARCMDYGFNPTCCGVVPPLSALYQIVTGSSNVYIGGSRAARSGIDITMHCFNMPVAEDLDQARKAGRHREQGGQGGRRGGQSGRRRSARSPALPAGVPGDVDRVFLRRSRGQRRRRHGGRHRLERRDDGRASRRRRRRRRHDQDDRHRSAGDSADRHARA